MPRRKRNALIADAWEAGIYPTRLAKIAGMRNSDVMRIISARIEKRRNKKEITTIRPEIQLYLSERPVYFSELIRMKDYGNLRVKDIKRGK